MSEQHSDSKRVPPEAGSGRNLTQIFIILIVLLALANVPLNAGGFGLAQLRPDENTLVISDGVLLAEPGRETIYVVDNHQLRPIESSLALRHAFNPERIRRVDREVLARFALGRPVRALVKCSERPAVFVIENGLKRQFEALPAAQPAPAWDRPRLVSCDYLSRLPDGPRLVERRN